MDREKLAFDSLMQAGQQLKRQSGPEADREGGVGHTLKTLQAQWDAANQKATDRQVLQEKKLFNG